MSVEHIRLSTQAKEQLIRLKRATGMKNWNVLCRWAFCISLADTSAPVEKPINTDSSVEMSWRVFGGEYQTLYFALLKERCKKDGFDCTLSVLNHQFKLHLHRGIAILTNDRSLRAVAGLFHKLPNGPKP